MPNHKGSACVGAFALTLIASGVQTALAQDQDQDQSKESSVVQEVVVTGYRAALRSALETKRESAVMVDAINSDDIADFPDANLAESLQRIPGISVDRDQGEGRTITVRGLGADFTRVRINGLEALSTAGANDAGSTPNRSRAFDFNTFASELFSSLKVQKTASAETDEGSLGATVDLTTGRPFDFKPFALGFSAEDSYYENGGSHNPKLAGLVSWHGEKFGALLSAAFSERETEVDQFRRGPGSSDYVYRQSDFAGNADQPQRGGFAAPDGTFTAGQIPNDAARNALQGSNAAAYANLYPGAPYNTPGRLDDSTVRFPALGSVEQSDVAYSRIGITNSYQWKPGDRTSVNVDLLYSKYEYESVINQVSTVGLNRNNTNATYNTATGPTTAGNLAARRGLYPGACTFNDGTGTAPPQDCGESLNGNTIVPGFTFSRNPNNLDPYEYYNNPLSPGYTVDPTGTGLAFRDRLIGRPAVDVLASNVTNGVADYLMLRNVDMRSAADASFYTTEFKQASLNIEHEFSDTFRGSLIYGQSESINDSKGVLVEFNSMDTQGPFTYDERGGGSMPIFDLGFDAADPANWGIVKGFSAMRHYKRLVENTFNGGKIDFVLDFNDSVSLGFGFNSRQYTFKTQQRERNTDTINPTELEAGVTTADLGRVITFGDGLDVPGGTIDFFAPDLAKFSEVFGFDCACINEYGDFRTIRRNNGRDDFEVIENDRGVYAQINFKTEVFGQRFYGNFGVRQAFTALDSIGNTNGAGGLAVRASNDYTDTLPSINLAYEPIDDLVVRAGWSKVMARPLLANLAPTITAISVPNEPPGGSGVATLTIGNPYLNPYRGKNIDLGIEWYFTEGAMLSAAYFIKDIDSVPQTVIFDGPLSAFVDAAGAAAIRAGFTNPNQLRYIDNDGLFRARQFRDAPGGELSGYELSYQQDLTFLPWHFKNLGLQVNYTRIDSDLTYILDPGNGTTIQPTYGKGPWLNASPTGLNATLYYETGGFHARVSLAKRAGYYTSFPIAAGTCGPGISGPIPASPNTAPTGASAYCNSPLINDFVGSRGTENIDASVRWNVMENLSITLEGLNLTDQTSDRYAYVSNPVVTQYGSTGRQFVLGARYRY
jgi:iron complex outermembrane receptor protein